MKTRAKLMPGQKGTKALQQKYGDAFLCVRYRYDEKNRKQYKTEKESNEPPHYICPKCFNDEKKAILQLKAVNELGTHYICISCDSKFCDKTQKGAPQKPFMR